MKEAIVCTLETKPLEECSFDPEALPDLYRFTGDSIGIRPCIVAEDMKKKIKYQIKTKCSFQKTWDQILADHPYEKEFSYFLRDPDNVGPEVSVVDSNLLEHCRILPRLSSIIHQDV